ncbi:MAG: hypothetical protein ACPIA5_02950, partial [Flavobacteriales bacterium]
MQWSSLLQWSAAGAACGLTFGAMSWVKSPNPSPATTVHTTSHTWTPSTGALALAARPATETPLSDDAFVRAAQSSVDAVVHVRTAQTMATTGGWSQFFGMPGSSQIQRGSGSGVILSEAG